MVTKNPASKPCRMMKNKIFSLLLTAAMALTVIATPLPKPKPIPDDPNIGAGNSDSPNCGGEEADIEI